MNSREKGKRGERDAAKALKEHLGWEAFRSAQVSGKFSADLLGVPDKIHIEVKFNAAISALRFMDQAVRDAKQGQIPLVLMRENKNIEWFVMVPLSKLNEVADVVCDTRTMSEVQKQRQSSKMA